MHVGHTLHLNKNSKINQKVQLFPFGAYKQTKCLELNQCIV